MISNLQSLIFIVAKSLASAFAWQHSWSQTCLNRSPSPLTSLPTLTIKSPPFFCCANTTRCRSKRWRWWVPTTDVCNPIKLTISISVLVLTMMRRELNWQSPAKLWMKRTFGFLLTIRKRWRRVWENGPK